MDNDVIRDLREKLAERTAQVRALEEENERLRNSPRVIPTVQLRTRYRDLDKFRIDSVVRVGSTHFHVNIEPTEPG